MIITTRYAVLREDDVWLEGGDTAQAAIDLARFVGGTVMECRLLPQGAKWVKAQHSTLARRAAIGAVMAATAGRR